MVNDRYFVPRLKVVSEDFKSFCPLSVLFRCEQFSPLASAGYTKTNHSQRLAESNILASYRKHKMWASSQ